MDASLVSELRAVVGERGIVEGRARLTPYESDGLALLRRRPELVVLPRDTGEAAAVMRLLHEAGVPVVARGAGTGLSGGATPVEGGVLVGTARMRDVLEVSTEDRFARVQAGVVNVQLTRCCAEHRLFYAPDPSSQMACTIGGNVANNSGGPHCFQYGNTTQHVLGLTMVLHDGQVLRVSNVDSDPCGYDLVGLFVGSEGTFGLATEVEVRLVPVPESVVTFLAVYRDLDAACDTVSAVIARGLQPSALEILDALTIQAVEDSVFAAGYPRDAGAVLLVECEGCEPEVEATVAAVREIAGANGAIDVETARDDKARQKLWAGRKGAFGAMGRIAPDLYVADAVVPRTKLRQLVARTVEIAREHDVRLATVFHAGDGNLHPNMCYDRRDEAETKRVLAAGDQILRECVEAGGSLTGEHGVGLEKLAAMRYLFTEDDLEVFRRVRAVWDPDMRLNPGKLVPMRACTEVRTRSPYPPPSDQGDAP
jgi:glycolate oxidase subunit GlcD